MTELQMLAQRITNAATSISANVNKVIEEYARAKSNIPFKMLDVDEHLFTILVEEIAVFKYMRSRL